MTQITVNENFQPNKYLLVSRIDESQDIQTTRILITDDNSNKIKVVTIEQGPQGDKGETGPQGQAGQDAPTFDVLPLSSGGTNNTTYSSGNIIFFDGEKVRADKQVKINQTCWSETTLDSIFDSFNDTFSTK